MAATQHEEDRSAGSERRNDDRRGRAAATPCGPLLGLWGDVRLAARRLLATPLFLIFAVVSLAAGISVTTVGYSVLHSTFWMGPGIPDPNSVAVVTGGSGAFRSVAMSRPDFEDVRTVQGAFTSLAASKRISATLVSPTASHMVFAQAVSGEYFHALGVEAMIGRVIQPEDDQQARAVVVLAYHIWRAWFREDSTVIGRVVRIGGHPFEVVGVAPPSFGGLLSGLIKIDVWVPLETTGLVATPSASPERRDRAELTVVGRIDPAYTMGRAAAEVSAIGRRLDADFPIVAPARGDQAPVVRQRLWSARTAQSLYEDDRGLPIGGLLLGLVTLVLVVACVNLANLVLARGVARAHEVAVRRALGASRWRLVRELLVENALLAGLGGFLALLFTRGLLLAVSGELPTNRGSIFIEPYLSVSALVVGSAAVLLSMLVFGVAPAIHVTRSTSGMDLAAGFAVVGGPSSRRERALIRWQVAISAIFFLLAATLGRVVAVGLRHDPGVDLDRLALATVYYLPREGWDEMRARRALAIATDALRQEPSIENVAVSSGVPFGMTTTTVGRVTTPDRPFVVGQRHKITAVLSATPDVFHVLGVPILRGRRFDERDDAGAPKVMVVSESTAQRLFGTADALGRQVVVDVNFRPPAETYMVVGIARDTYSDRHTSDGDAVVYVPFAQHYEFHLVVMARTSGNPRQVAGLLQDALRRADPDLGIGTAGPASVLMAGSLFAARVAGAIAMVLALLTLVLGMVGLFGVQAHVVARRTREVGVRIALGAGTSQIKRMVLADGLRPVIEGIVLGATFGVIVRLGLRATLSADISAVDPIVFGMMPLPLALAAFLACYLPARWASRVDPNVALRDL